MPGNKESDRCGGKLHWLSPAVALSTHDGDDSTEELQLDGIEEIGLPPCRVLTADELERMADMQLTSAILLVQAFFIRTRG